MLKFKTTGSSSPSILTKKNFCPAIGGAGPLVYDSDAASVDVQTLHKWEMIFKYGHLLRNPCWPEAHRPTVNVYYMVLFINTQHNSSEVQEEISYPWQAGFYLS